MKRIVSFLVVFVLLLSAVPVVRVGAASIPTDTGMLEWYYYDGQVYIADGSTGTNVVIPASIDGKPVRHMGIGAFVRCETLQSIELSPYLYTIKGNAFGECYNLKTVVMYSKVTDIEDEAFSWCESLETVFYTGTKEQWESINIGSGNEYLERRDVVYNFDAEAGVRYGTLQVEGGTVNYYICNGEVTISSGSEGKDLVIPAEIEGCPVTAIGCHAFWTLPGLEHSSVKLPDSIRRIGAEAFHGREINAVMPSALEYIGDNALYYCSSLSVIAIPASLKKLGDNALPYYSLEAVYYEGSEEELMAVEKGTGNEALATLPIQYGYDRSEDIVKTFETDRGLLAYYVVNDEAVITEGSTWTEGELPYQLNGIPVVAVGQCAFLSCGDMTSVVIPSGVERVGRGAFSDCELLVAAVISDSVKVIDSGAFYNCGALESVDFGNGVEYIGSEAFEYCYSLENLRFPDCLKVIGDRAFVGCSFTRAEIPGSVEELGFDFMCCENISFISICDGVLEIPAYAFRDLQALKVLSIPASVVKIERRAFKGTDNIEAVYYGGTAEQWAALTSNVEELSDVTVYYESTVTTGDVDDDGELSMLDLFRLKLFVKQEAIPTEKEILALDIDGDGEINMVDSFEMKYRISKGSWR